MLKFDFILFENFHLAVNHYKDIVIIAEYLKASGFSVAIADVFQEDKYCIVDNVPHITINSTKFTDPLVYDTRKGLISYLNNGLKQLKLDKYLMSVAKEIEPQGRVIYAGSYHNGMSTKWIQYLAKRKSVIFWGLRSSRMHEYKIRPISIVGFNSYLLRRCVDRFDNIKFFISDELIRNEFLIDGFSENRLILRPERYITNYPVSKVKRTKTSLLTIGTIRETKQVEMGIKAIKNLHDMNYSYTIAGKSSDEYESKLYKLYSQCKNITRINYRIPDIEFQRLYKLNDFLLLCDKQQNSLVTNGTMNEAIFNGMPIIAPNYDPYKYYIETYHIGLLYNANDVADLESVIHKAGKLGPGYFADAIYKYCIHYHLSEITNIFKNEITQKIEL